MHINGDRKDKTRGPVYQGARVKPLLGNASPAKKTPAKATPAGASDRGLALSMLVVPTRDTTHAGIDPFPRSEKQAQKPGNSP